jgi:hypothetical protein
MVPWRDGNGHPSPAAADRVDIVAQKQLPRHVPSVILPPNSEVLGCVARGTA